MKTKIFLIFFILVVLVTAGNIVRKEHPEDIQREKILNTAKKIIESSKYCVLITTGLDGFPSARIMDPFPPESRWTIWMGTNSNSRKIKEIRRSNRSKNVSVYYESPGGDGYLVLKGWAVIVDDPDKKKKYFKKGWEQFYPGNKESFVLIRFTTVKLEVVSYKNGLTGDPVTWEAPSLSFYKTM